MTEDNGLQFPVHSTRIQDSFAGYSFDEVIRMTEEERRKQEGGSKKKEEREEDKKPEVHPTVTTPTNPAQTKNPDDQIIKQTMGKKEYRFQNVPYRDAPNKVLPEVVITPEISQGVLGTFEDQRRTYNHWKECVLFNNLNCKEEKFIPTAELIYQLIRQARQQAGNAPFHPIPQEFIKDMKEKVYSDKTQGITRRIKEIITGRRIITATTIQFMRIGLTIRHDHLEKGTSLETGSIPLFGDYNVREDADAYIALKQILGQGYEDTETILTEQFSLQKNWRRYINGAYPPSKDRKIILRLPSLDQRQEPETKNLETRVTIGTDTRGRILIDCSQEANKVKGYVITVNTPGVTL